MRPPTFSDWNFVRRIGFLEVFVGIVIANVFHKTTQITAGYILTATGMILLALVILIRPAEAPDE